MRGRTEGNAALSAVLNSLSTEELWALHDAVIAKLKREAAAQRAEREAQLYHLGAAILRTVRPSFT